MTLVGGVTLLRSTKPGTGMASSTLRTDTRYYKTSPAKIWDGLCAIPHYYRVPSSLSVGRKSKSTQSYRKPNFWLAGRSCTQARQSRRRKTNQLWFPLPGLYQNQRRRLRRTLMLRSRKRRNPKVLNHQRVSVHTPRGRIQYLRVR